MAYHTASFNEDNTINNITDIIDILKPNWTQRMVLDIHLNDLLQRSYKEGYSTDVKSS